MSLSTCESGQRPFEWVFLLLCLIPVACSQDVTSTLELAAAPGLTLPGSAVALGGITHGSSFVYWDDLALYDSDGRTLCAEGGTLAARSEAGRIHYLTVTGVVGEVADGSRTCETHAGGVSVRLPILAAAWGTSGLFVLDSALDVHVVSGSRSKLVYDARTSVTPKLFPHSKGLIIAESTPPFSWKVVSVEGNLLDEVTPDTGLSADEMLAWGGVGVFHLPPGYLQIIADRRGDERIMVIFDESGQQVRQNRLTAAWGVLSASPGGKLLAVRRTDVLEVLPYNWAWHGPVP